MTAALGVMPDERWMLEDGVITERRQPLLRSAALWYCALGQIRDCRFGDADASLLVVYMLLIPPGEDPDLAERQAADAAALRQGYVNEHRRPGEDGRAVCIRCWKDVKFRTGYRQIVRQHWEQAKKVRFGNDCAFEVPRYDDNSFE